MKTKTYNNFMKVMKVLTKQKGYDWSEAEQIAHKVFANTEADKQYGNRSVEYFLSLVIDKAEWEGRNE